MPASVSFWIVMKTFLDLFGRLGAVDRRVDDGVVHEQHVVLGAPVPVHRVAGELVVEGVVGAERIHQRRLVVRRAPHPAIGHPRPGGDGVALADQVLAGLRHAEELVGEAAIAGVGRAGQRRLGGGIVERIIEPGDGAGGVAERRMRRDIGDALAIDVDLAAVAQAFEIFLAGERPVGRGEVLGLAFEPWACPSAPSPALAGEGRGGGRFETYECPLPSPPPQAGGGSSRPRLRPRRGPSRRAGKWPVRSPHERHESGDCWNNSARRDGRSA